MCHAIHDIIHIFLFLDTVSFPLLLTESGAANMTLWMFFFTSVLFLCYRKWSTSETIYKIVFFVSWHLVFSSILLFYSMPLHLYFCSVFFYFLTSCLFLCYRRWNSWSVKWVIYSNKERYRHLRINIMLRFVITLSALSLQSLWDQWCILCVYYVYMFVITDLSELSWWDQSVLVYIPCILCALYLYLQTKVNCRNEISCVYYMYIICIFVALTDGGELSQWDQSVEEAVEQYTWRQRLWESTVPGEGRPSQGCRKGMGKGGVWK